MKKLFLTLSLVTLASSNLMLATSHEKSEKKEAKQNLTTAKPTHKNTSKKALKDMIHDLYAIGQDNKKYVGYFLRTNKGKDLVKKADEHLKKLTPKQLAELKEFKDELKEKFAAYQAEKKLTFALK